MKPDSSRIALDIIKTLTYHGYVAYFAGGWVRDHLLGIPSTEIDIATNASPEKIRELFPKTIPVGISFGVVIVVIEGQNFEITTFRKDLEYKDGRHPEGVDFSTPEEDAKRRDFTINGMFYDPLTKEVLDFVHGKADLEKKIVRAIGNPEERFQEDRLRMVRAFRFMARFNFVIEEKTLAAIKKFAPTIFPSVSMERITQELTKMSAYPGFFEGLREMERAGLLSIILPGAKLVKFPPFPPETPLIVYLLELYQGYPLKKKLELCKYLKLSNKDVKIVEFFHEADRFFSSQTNDRYEWTKFYANPYSTLYLSQFQDQTLHETRRQELFIHIKRMEENKPLITATLLQNEGILPGKTMGFLLKEGEKMVVNEDIHNEKVAVDRLKKSPLWPTL